jgi:hypothetical protein
MIMGIPNKGLVMVVGMQPRSSSMERIGWEPVVKVAVDW